MAKFKASFPVVWVLLLVVFVAFSYAEEGPFAVQEQNAEPPEGQELLVEEVDLTCPMDGTKVKGYKIKAFVSTGTDRDFCQLYAGRSLYDIWITCCPNTGYCGYIEDFNITLPPDVKEKILKEITPNYNLKKIAPWDRYKIAAQIYKWRGKPEIDIGNTYLRGTYTFRYLPIGPERREKEKKLRAMAIKYLRKADKKGQFKLEEMSSGKYLIGELYRRNEKYGSAIKYFRNALKIKNQPEWLEKWANEQMAKAFADYAD